MNKQIIVNMPVKDLDKSKAFFSALGYTFHPTFSTDQAALMIIADNSINAMLMTEPFFKSFHTKQITNTREAIEMWVCLTCESREEVDSLMARALAAGATATGAAQDHGFMYGHGFEDLDGHTWQLNYMSSMPG
ncbi:MAG: VOC family protein [Telluria sp.]